MKHEIEEIESICICKVCGLFEGSLTTDCCKEDASRKSEDVYEGRMDFREGIGWVKSLNPTNLSWVRVMIIRLSKEKNKTGKEIKKDIHETFPYLDEFNYFRIKKDVSANNRKR